MSRAFLPGWTIFPFLVPGVLSTISLVLINAIPDSLLEKADDTEYLCEDHSPTSRMALFGALILLFGSIIGSVFMYSLQMTMTEYQGVSVVGQTLLIGSSAFLFRLGRNKSRLTW